MSDSGQLFKERVGARQAIKGKYYHRLINGIVNDINKGYAPVIVISGQMGKGKSMAALELVRILHNEINLMEGELKPDNVKDHLVYEVLPFLEAVSNNRRKCLMFDEAGVNLNSKDWYSDFNRSVDKTIQTMRKKNNAYIFITPRILDLDKSIRNHINYKIEAVGKGVLKPTKIRARYGKIESKGSKVNKYPLFKPYWKPDLPPEELQKPYREKENEFKDKDLEQHIEDIKEKKKEEEKEKKTADASDLF